MSKITKLDIEPKEFELIKGLVMENPYYEGNEDFLADFCNEVYSKSYLLFNSVKNYEYLSSYLKKIVNTSIIAVLKANARTKSLNLKEKTRFMSDMTTAQKSENEQSLRINSSPNSGTAYDIYKLDDPFEENDKFLPDKHQILNIMQLLEFVNTENMNKRYNDIFVLRYAKKCAPETIAFKLNVSESEINQRLLDLAEIINANINIKKYQN